MFLCCFLGFGWISHSSCSWQPYLSPGRAQQVRSKIFLLVHTGRKVNRSKESRSVAFSKMLRNLNLLNTNTFPYFLINRLIFTDNPLFIYLLQQIERLIKRVVTILHDQMKFTLYFAITTMPDCLADNDRWCIIFYYMS